MNIRRDIIFFGGWNNISDVYSASLYIFFLRLCHTTFTLTLNTTLEHFMEILQKKKSESLILCGINVCNKLYRVEFNAN